MYLIKDKVTGAYALKWNGRYLFTIKDKASLFLTASVAKAELKKVSIELKIPMKELLVVED